MFIVAIAMGVSYISTTGYVTLSGDGMAEPYAIFLDSGSAGLAVSDAAVRIGNEPETQQQGTQDDTQMVIVQGIYIQPDTQEGKTAPDITPAAEPPVAYHMGSVSGYGSEGSASSPPCAPSWRCSAWSPCSAAGSQNRICTDANSCGTGAGKPAEMQLCEYSALYITPVSLDIKMSENRSFGISVDINTTHAIYAIWFDIRFDKNRLNASSITEGGFLKRGGINTYCASLAADNSLGRISYACTRFSTATGASGNGTVATVIFEAVGSGSSRLTLYSARATDSGMNEVGISVFNGTVSIS